MPIESRIVDSGVTTKPIIVCIHGGGCNARYFDLPGFSFRERAVARGYPLLLVNRPGHGGSMPAVDDFSSSAAAILAHVRDRLGTSPWSSGYFMLGHSIGAAVATIIAGDLQPKGLRGLALSGIGDRPTSAALAWARKLDVAQPDASLAGDLLFGPQSSFSWRAPKALRQAAESWCPVEVEETLKQWPSRFLKSARRVAVPVHLRLAEAERIWETGPSAIRRLTAFFTNAPWIDAGLLPEGGHLYEVHRRGHELMASQLDFFDRVATFLASDNADGIPGRP